ncbi:hypothetical protein VX159_10545 [Dechloromonas sp. ZY10]|uniref:hypothetical protein n=1 Tax=Dechloromonas aquae TaxID=2664436 RepID=UPI0035272BC3
MDFIPLTIMKRLILLILFLISNSCLSAGGGTGAGAFTVVQHKGQTAYATYMRQKYGVDLYSTYSYSFPSAPWRFISSSGDCPSASYSPSDTYAERCLGSTVFFNNSTGSEVYEIHVVRCGAIGDGWAVNSSLECYRDCSVVAGGLIEPYLYQTNAWTICDQSTLSCQTGAAWPSGYTDYRCEDGCRVLVDLTDAGKNLFGGCVAGTGASKENPLPLFCYVKQAGFTGANCSLTDTPKKPTSGTTQAGDSWSSSTSTSTGTGGDSGGAAPGDSTSTSGGSPTGGTSGSGTDPGTSGPGTGDGTGTGTGAGPGDGPAGIYGQNRCADSFLCTGDAVQCGVAREAWMARCIAEQVNSLEGNDNSVFDPNRPFGTDDFKQKGDDALNKNGLFDFDVMEAFQKNRQEYFSFAAGCISSVPVNIYGNLLTVDLSILCEFGKFIRLIMHIAAYLIVLRLMHRTLV